MTFQTLRGTAPPFGGLFVIDDGSNLAGRYANGGRLFLMKWLRCAREQQQQVDARIGQAASRTPGRWQVDFFDRGGISEKRRGRPRTDRYLEGQGKVSQ
jgi:hypothetical protein